RPGTGLAEDLHAPAQTRSDRDQRRHRLPRIHDSRRLGGGLWPRLCSTSPHPSLYRSTYSRRLTEMSPRLHWAARIVLGASIVVGSDQRPIGGFMDELMQAIQQRTGLPADKAQGAAQAALDFLKEKLPAGIGD